MFLMIRNPGVADWRGFTLIGASTTRYNNYEGTIGQFGSGSKHAVALCLRNELRPMVFTGNLKMEFFSKPEYVSGKEFNRVSVKFSGKDLDGSTKNTTDDLGFTLEWGVQDWSKLAMALREFVANAIDGAITVGRTYSDVEFEVVQKPRAKAGYTSVFLPYTPEVEKIYRDLGLMFLHFGAPDLLKKKLLPKRNPQEDKILVYKKGVLVSFLPGKSIFDYNLGHELSLDESRNASEWDVMYAVALALRDAEPLELATILKKLTTVPDLWEGRLSPSYLSTASHEKQEVREKRQAAFQSAWKAIAGTKGVATLGNPALVSLVEHKGFDAKTFSSGAANWLQVLEGYGVPTETTILSKNERDGKEIIEPTKDMNDAVNWAWDLLNTFNLLNGNARPLVKGFMQIMDAGSQTWGIYDNGIVYLHKELGGSMLKKVALEEVVHHVTGAGDGSRDIQDFLFRLIVEMAG
jgi:hypothetical protein